MWKRGNKKGTTLLETILVLTVLTFVILAVTSVFIVGIKAWSGVDKEAKLAQQGALLSERLMRELRGINAIYSAEADEIIIQSGGGEIIKYEIDGKELIKQGGGKNISLAKNLSSFQFSYYDGGNALLGFPVEADDVALVKIILTIEDEKESLGLTSGVNPRRIWIKKGLP